MKEIEIQLRQKCTILTGLKTPNFCDASWQMNTEVKEAMKIVKELNKQQ